MFSYNDEQKVNYVLRDRMCKIQTTGYSKPEMEEICVSFLVPKTVKSLGFSEQDVVFPRKTVRHIIHEYCGNDTGVRRLKQCIENVCTKLNLFRLTKPDSTVLTHFATLDISTEFPIEVTPAVANALLSSNSSTLSTLLSNNQTTTELSVFNNLDAANQIDVIDKFKCLRESDASNSNTRDMKFAVNIMNCPAISAHNKLLAMDKIGIANKLETQDKGGQSYMAYKKWLSEFSKIPFGKYVPVPCNMRDNTMEECTRYINLCKKTLDDRLYGMRHIKTRIIEFIGQLVAVHVPSALNLNLAIRGAPGTAKKHIVQIIGDLLGRPIEVVALRDMCEYSMDGNYMNYDGSACGRLIRALISSKSANPIIYFEGVDKISLQSASHITTFISRLTNPTKKSALILR